MSVDVAAASDFIWREARLLDRRRWELMTGGTDPAPLVAAVAAYQNADGGFGSGLEPDLRTPTSQPVAAQVALERMHEVAGAAAGAVVDRLVRWCAANADPATGGLPYVLTSATAHPRAPWWDPEGDPPPPSLNPTAAIVGLLFAAGSQGPWLEVASAWVKATIDADPTALRAHTALCAATYMAHTPDRPWAERVGPVVGAALIANGGVMTAPGESGYGVSPLWFAPTPDSFAHAWFDPVLLESFLDAVEGSQEEDGGWPLSWHPPSAAARAEWRGAITVDNIRTLAAYGRIAVEALAR